MKKVEFIYRKLYSGLHYINLTRMKKLLIAITFSFVLFSCGKNFLNPEQIDLVYNDVFWSNENDAEKAVLGVYALYRGIMVTAEMYERGDVTTGYYRRGWNGGSPDALYQMVNIPANQRAWGNLDGMANWGNYYKVIAMANLTLSRIEKMDDGLFSSGNKNRLLGEVYFLRALTYYNIATIWGHAPLILDPIESSEQVIDADNLLINRARVPDVEIMNTVLEDVAKAISLLSFGRPGSDDWGVIANKGSALALSGYANMWMAFLKKRDGASPNEYYTQAVTDLENVVTNGGYVLASYGSREAVQNLFKGKSSESVFELSVSAALGESYRVDAGGIQYLTCKIPPFDGDVKKDRASSINWVPAIKKPMMYPEYPQDKRADWFFAAWESPYNDPFSDVSQTAVDRELVTWLTKFASFTPDPSRQWNEYLGYFADANIPVFRFTDVKLLLAEAYYYTNQSSKAIPIINEIRQRAGLSNYSGSDVLKAILQERTSELQGEGKLFFDYIRNGFIENMPHIDAARYNQQGYYWPVGSNILLRNKMIQQTPYWNGKTSW